MNDKGKGRYFTITTDKGDTVEYEMLFTFDSEETNKSYIVFTDGTEDASGNLNTYAATYKENGEQYILNDIETDKEWSIIEGLLSQIEDKMNEE